MNLHGEIIFTWEADLFTLEAKGPFNEIGLEYWFSEIKKQVIAKGFLNWRRLEIWDDEALSTPKGLDIAKIIFDWYEQNGCILVAVVISNSLQEQIIKESFKSKAEIFHDIETAKTWISSQP